MLFSRFSEYLQKLEKTSSRLEITAILKDLFKETKENEIKEVVYLSLGILAPNYEGLVLNLAEKMVARAIAIAYNKNLDDVTKLYKETGDLGEVAEMLSKTQKIKNSKNQNVQEVFLKLVKIANDSGEGSQDRKIENFAKLIKNLDPLSVRFVTRIPTGRLRLGFSEKTILDALRQAQGELSEDEIESAYNVRPDIGYIAELVKSNKLQEISPKVGVPVVPMLCQRIGTYEEMIKKMGEVSVEPKFDGLRIFIHFQKPNYLKIFTRNMNALDENIFPELKEVGKYIKADSVILDTEAIGLDETREKFVDFQKTIQRRRKHDIDKSSSETPLQFQVFDILMVDGKNLINEKYIKRREELEKRIGNSKLLRVDENTITSDPKVIKDLHEKYLKLGLEGVVVKRANGKYVSGRTGWNWVKMKEEEGMKGRLSDTIDAVIMGYSVGKGKRSGFGVGQFLAGVLNGENVVTLTKVGTGITDEQFKILNEKLKEIISNKKPKEYDVHKDLTPDYWVLPKIVVELAADEITVSPKHTSNYALRFPRLIKFREDKGLKDITNLDEIEKLFKLQKV